MRFPSFYTDMYEPVRKLNETPFGTNFLVRERADVASPSEESSPQDDELATESEPSQGPTDEPSDTPPQPKELVLMPLERTSSALPYAQIKQEIQSLTRLDHPGILAPLHILEREHHRTQQMTMALVRRYVAGEPFLRFATLAKLNFDGPILTAGSHTSDSEAPSDLLTNLSEDTDEVSLIISEVSRSDRNEGIALLGERLVRLSQILPKLLDALAYIHRYKRFHGALSPDCIFIDAQHDVHIADAGLWHIMQGHEEDEQSEPPMHDRPHQRRNQINLYRAPEVFMGEPPSAASDLYSLGCLLFHALCGEPAFRGDHDLAHHHAHAPRPSVLAHQPQCPSAWARLVNGLIQQDPAQRPTLEDLHTHIAELPTQPTQLIVATPPEPRSYCGRPALLDELELRASESRTNRLFQPTVLMGDVGQGKHYFVDHLAARLARKGWIVCRGRCYADASDPYQGWRYLIQDMVELIEQAPKDLKDLLAPHRVTASTIFPALGDPDAVQEPPALIQRLEATLGLRALCDILSYQRPLLLVFDDLHLATRDTLELLYDVMASDTGFEGMLLVTARPDSEAMFPEHKEEHHAPMHIPALSLEESKALLKELVPSGYDTELEPLWLEPHTHAPQLIKEIVHELKHTPDVSVRVQELVQTAQTSATTTELLLQDILERRYGKLEQELPKSLLALLALSAGPISQDVLMSALSHLVSPSPQAKVQDAALTELATLRLLKRLTLHRSAMMSYRISGELCRALVLTQMSEEQVMLTHSAWSKALAKLEGVSTTLVFEHARRALRTSEARRLAEPALAEARDQLAFSRAAEIQSWLITQREEEGEAQRQELAELETASGKHKEAAELWQKMADEHEDEHERTLALCEASEAWFYAGDLDKAALMQEQALSHLNQHYAPLTTQNRWNAVKLSWSRAFARSPKVLPEAILSHDSPGISSTHDALRARIYTLLLQTNPMLNTSQAPTFERRLRRLALAHHDPEALANAYLHYAQLLVELDYKRAMQLAQTYLEHALQLFAHTQNFAKQAEVNVVQAYLAQCAGSWDKARALYSSAEELWRASSATTRMARVELDYKRGLYALAHGDLEDVSRMIESLFYEERHLAPAQIRGHQLTVHKALLCGDLQEAAQHMHHIEQMLSTKASSLLSFWHIEQSASLYIVQGQPSVALGRLELVEETLAKDPMFGSPRIRARFDLKMAQCLCAQITRDFYTDRPRRKELLKRLNKLVAQLGRQQAQLTQPERAALQRVKMRALWLMDKPRKALKYLEGIDESGNSLVGRYAIMVQRDARGQLLRALDDQDTNMYLDEAYEAYRAQQIYDPLVLEGWPASRRRDDAEDEG